MNAEVFFRHLYLFLNRAFECARPGYTTPGSDHDVEWSIRGNDPVVLTVAGDKRWLDIPCTMFGCEFHYDLFGVTSDVKHDGCSVTISRGARAYNWGAAEFRIHWETKTSLSLYAISPNHVPPGTRSCFRLMLLSERLGFTVKRGIPDGPFKGALPVGAFDLDMEHDRFLWHCSQDDEFTVEKISTTLKVPRTRFRSRPSDHPRVDTVYWLPIYDFAEALL